MPSLRNKEAVTKAAMEKILARAKTYRGMHQPLREPLWKGPEVDGITQSMLGTFIGDCREKCRLRWIDGVGGLEQFNVPIEFGNMFHLAEETHLDGRDWQAAVKKYVEKLRADYPFSKDMITKWHRLLLIQYPLYLEYWSKHPATTRSTPILQEVSFRVPYKLPNGRTVILRGKWDSVDWTDGGIWLQENKTKGTVDKEDIMWQLKYDLQTLFYPLALLAQIRNTGLIGDREVDETQFVGVRYNVIKRPLSSGKYCIRRHKEKITKNTHKPEETLDAYYERLQGLMANDQAYFFHRWNSHLDISELDSFAHNFLDPALTQVLNWYDWVKHCHVEKVDPFDSTSGIHYRRPYGLWSATDNKVKTPLDNYLNEGTTSSLRRLTTVFPELDD